MGRSPVDAEPSRWRELRPRLASALVIAPAALIMILGGEAPSAALVAGLSAVMAWEIWRMVRVPSEAVDRRAEVRIAGRALQASVVLAPPLAVAAIVYARDPDYLLAFVFLYLILFAFLPPFRRLNSLVFPRDGRRWIALAVGVVALGAVGFAALRASDGAMVVLWLVVVVSAADTGAYFVGRAVGGPRLWPRVSPKKTWSGFAAALISGGAASVAVFAIQGVSASVGAFVCGAAVALAGQSADLAESAFKRRFDRKDASGLIPGHGGVLDRLDSLIGATFAVVLARAAGVDMWGGL